MMDNNSYDRMPLLTTRSASCPKEFSVTHRRVYSYLAYRSRLGLDASQRQVGTEARLDSRSLKKCLSYLHDAGLVELDSGRWRAVPPSGETEKWFVPNRQNEDNRHWSQQYAYSMLFWPAKNAKVADGDRRRFTIHHAHVYSMLFSLSRRSDGIISRCDVGKIRRLLNGMDSKTISNALAILGEVRLVTSVKVNGHLDHLVKPISKRQERLFCLATKQPQDKQAKSDEEIVCFEDVTANDMFQHCTSHGIPQDLAKRITLVAKSLRMELGQLLDLSKQAEGEHSLNRKAGKIDINHHGHLLLHKLDVWKEEEEAEIDRLLGQTMDHRIGEPPPAAPHSNGDSATRPSVLTSSSHPEVRVENPSYTRVLFAELSRTRKFLVKKFGDLPDAGEIAEAIKDGRLTRWLNFNKVSPYYVMLGKEIGEAIGDATLDDALHFDFSTFWKHVSDHLRSHYAKLFEAKEGESDCDEQTDEVGDEEDEQNPLFEILDEHGGKMDFETFKTGLRQVGV